MSSKLDVSYLENGRTSSFQRKLRENVYYTMGEYCGLSSTNPLRDRNSALTYPSGSGYNDRRRQGSSRESRDRTFEMNDHIRRHFLQATSSSSSSTQSGIQPHNRPRDPHLPSSSSHSSSSYFNTDVVVEQPRIAHYRDTTPLPSKPPPECPPRKRLTTESPVRTRNQEHVTDNNMNTVKGKHPALKPPDIQIAFDHTLDNSNDRQAIRPLSKPTPVNPRIQIIKDEERATKNPPLGVAFPRPHSVDYPEKKSQLKRTLSAPELRASSSEEQSNPYRNSNNDKRSDLHVRPHPTTLKPPKGNIDPRSKSLPSVSLPRNFKLRTPSSRDVDPLRYFAYLGKRFQFRERLPSAHNLVTARPVILTSTSIISPEVSNNFREEEEEDEDLSSTKGTCQDLIDCCTCMCCVKALFYHCTKDDDTEGEAAEHPCSCSRPVGQCIARWSVLGLLSACMPCLICYLPIQGCKRCVEYFRRKEGTDI